MNFALTYLIQRFFYRLYDFFHHWYVDASKVFFHRLISFMEELDQNIALKVTFRYFFQPLFKDYSVIGRILGVVFRTGRIFLGLLVYFVIIVIFVSLYMLWLSAPAILVFYGFGNR